VCILQDKHCNTGPYVLKYSTNSHTVCVLGHKSYSILHVYGPTVWSLILCIMGSATVVNPASTVELIEMPCGCEFGWTQ